MSAGWLVYVLVVGALLAVAATALAAALRQLGRPTRTAYAAATAGLVALALAAPRRAPAPPDVSHVQVVEGKARMAPRDVTLADRARAARVALTSATNELSATLQRIVTPAVARGASIGWALATGALLVLFALVNARMLAARRRWPVRAVQGVDVRVAPALGPAVVGIVRAEIVVPCSLLERSAEEQRLILAHEREHLRARDHLLLSGAWLSVIAFPWHPAVWYLANRMRLAIELDCDARVLRGGASLRSYGALLIDMASHPAASRVGALALADGKSHLERRILAMKANKGRHAALRGLALCTAGAMLVLAACEAKVPTAAEVEAMDVGAAEKQALALKVADARVAKPDYFLDGVRVSAERAHAIDGKDIGSIEIVKSEHPAGKDTIFLTSRTRMPEENLLAKISAEGLEPDSRTAERVRTPSSAPRNASAPKLRMPSDPSVLVTIDGKEATRAQLEALDPAMVTSISVYKSGPEVAARSKTASGLVEVKTRMSPQRR